MDFVHNHHVGNVVKRIHARIHWQAAWPHLVFQYARHLIVVNVLRAQRFNVDDAEQNIIVGPLFNGFQSLFGGTLIKDHAVFAGMFLDFSLPVILRGIDTAHNQTFANQRSGFAPDGSRNGYLTFAKSGFITD